MALTLSVVPRTQVFGVPVLDESLHPYRVVWTFPYYDSAKYPSAQSALQGVIAKYHRSKVRGLFIERDGAIVISEQACDDICQGKREWVSDLLNGARRRAKKRWEDFQLTAADLHGLVDRQGEVCALSGIPFEFEQGDGFRRPWAPSLDRIDSSKGYAPDNVRLVCVAVNFAMNEWGEAVLRRMALAVAAKS